MGTLTITSRAAIGPTPFAFGIVEGSCKTDTAPFPTLIFIKRGGVALTSATLPLIGDVLYQDIDLTIPFTNLNNRVNFRIGVPPLLYNLLYSVNSSGEIIDSVPCFSPTGLTIRVVNNEEIIVQGAEPNENIILQFDLNSSNNSTNSNNFILARNLVNVVQLGLGVNQSSTEVDTNSSGGSEDNLYQYTINGNNAPVVVVTIIARSSSEPIPANSTVTITQVP